MENNNNNIENYFLGWMYSDGCIRYLPKKYIYVAKIKLKNEISEKKVFEKYIKNKKGRSKTPYYVLKSKSINYSLLKNKPYKNFSFKYY